MILLGIFRCYSEHEKFILSNYLSQSFIIYIFNQKIFIQEITQTLPQDKNTNINLIGYINNMKFNCEVCWKWRLPLLRLSLKDFLWSPKY